MIFPYIIMAIDINGTDFATRPWWYGLEPFVVTFGGIENVLAIFLGYIGGAVYIGSDKNKFITTLYMLSCVFFFALFMQLAPVGWGIMAMFTLLSAFILTSIFKDRLTGGNN